MIQELVHLNNPQLISVVNNPKSQIDVWGRGTGKSFIVGWEMNNIIRTMPGAICSITRANLWPIAHPYPPIHL